MSVYAKTTVGERGRLMAWHYKGRYSVLGSLGAFGTSGDGAVHCGGIVFLVKKGTVGCLGKKVQKYER